MSSLQPTKSCRDCQTTTTPLWRAGPEGPQSLCNACGLRYRKKRLATLGLDYKGPAQKSRKRNTSRSGKPGGISRDEGFVNTVRNKEHHRSLGKQSRFKEEEEAAVLLMALSCGSLCPYYN